jgi:hypothetical protein
MITKVGPFNRWKTYNVKIIWLSGTTFIIQKGCIQLAAASDKVYQMHAHGRWFFPGTPVSSTTTTGRHDIAEILL